MVVNYRVIAVKILENSIESANNTDKEAKCI